jgi:hypothetical protein
MSTRCRHTIKEWNRVDFLVGHIRRKLMAMTARRAGKSRVKMLA